MQSIFIIAISIISLSIIIRLLYEVLDIKKLIPKEETIEQVPENETDETSIFSKQVASYLNELSIPYFVDQKGNQITIEYPNKVGCPRIFINMVPEDSLPIYRLLMLKDFPDERLYKFKIPYKYLRNIEKLNEYLYQNLGMQLIMINKLENIKFIKFE